MKIVVLGASGLVGSHVMSACLARGHRVVGSARSAGSPVFRQLELSDQIATFRLLAAEKPDAVVYAAGWTWVDGCEADPARSRRENFELPLGVARWCVANDVRFLNYSSSYVFDGLTGCYAEADDVCPINVYGRHKADAEKAILDVSCGQALIPRLICVWGEEAGRKNFVYQIIDAALGGVEKRVPNDQIGNPTWAGDIAAWSIGLIEAAASGVWHLAGNHPEMSRVGWADCIRMGIVTRKIKPTFRLVPTSTSELGQKAPRPLLAGMLNSRIQAALPLNCREPSDIPASLC